jgi:peptidoglycan-N-acetylglucosamine deacetylase
MRPAAILVALFSVCAAAPAQNAPFHWPGGASAAVSLTYDDGIDGHLDNVVPDLEKAGLRGTFYVPGNSASLRRRLTEWRAAAARGHEIGNHKIFHPCLRHIPGIERTFVTPETALEGYSVKRIAEEIRTMNTLLLALDGKDERTLAYTCGDELAGGVSYVDAIHPMFPAARGYRRGGKTLSDSRTLDPHRVGSWAAQDVTGKELIAWVEEAAQSGSFAVFCFHGVGGGHGINVGREEHAQLVRWLGQNRSRVWTVPFLEAMDYILRERAGKNSK